MKIDKNRQRELYKMFQHIIANYIGTNILKGVHYFNVGEEEKEVSKYIDKLGNKIIENGEGQSELIERMACKGGEICVLNEELCTQVAIDLFSEIGEKNKKLSDLVNHINIDYNRKEEIKQLVNYLKEVDEREIDVYLYKEKGMRTKHIYFREGKQNYEKEIKGYRLTLDDIEEVNDKLGAIGKKINEVEPHEMIERTLGLRFTLRLGKADYID